MIWIVACLIMITLFVALFNCVYNAPQAGGGGHRGGPHVIKMRGHRGLKVADVIKIGGNPHPHPAMHGLGMMEMLAAAAGHHSSDDSSLDDDSSDDSSSLASSTAPGPRRAKQKGNKARLKGPKVGGKRKKNKGKTDRAPPLHKSSSPVKSNGQNTDNIPSISEYVRRAKAKMMKSHKQRSPTGRAKGGGGGVGGKALGYKSSDLDDSDLDKRAHKTAKRSNRPLANNRHDDSSDDDSGGNGGRGKKGGGGRPGIRIDSDPDSSDI